MTQRIAAATDGKEDHPGRCSRRDQRDTERAHALVQHADELKPGLRWSMSHIRKLTGRYTPITMLARWTAADTACTWARCPPYLDGKRRRAQQYSLAVALLEKDAPRAADLPLRGRFLRQPVPMGAGFKTIVVLATSRTTAAPTCSWPSAPTAGIYW